MSAINSSDLLTNLSSRLDLIDFADKINLGGRLVSILREKTRFKYPMVVLLMAITITSMTKLHRRPLARLLVSTTYSNRYRPLLMLCSRRITIEQL